MNRAAWLQDRRMRKFRDVLSRWEVGGLSMLEAGGACHIQPLARRVEQSYRVGILKRLVAEEGLEPPTRGL
jgi:hypothetical protein